MNPRVTIVIPVYGYSKIEEVFASLDGYPAVAVDNTPAGEAKDAIAAKAARFPNIRYLPQVENLGVTGGRNKGFEQVETEFVLFLDHDVSLAPGAVEGLIVEFERIERTGPIGILTGKVVYKDNPEVVWAAGTDISLVSGQVKFRGGPDRGQFEQACRVGVAPSIIFTRSDYVRRYGGFDDLFFANYDDTEFCFRFAAHGKPVWYTPVVKGFHDLPLTGGDPRRLLDRGYYIARNRILFMRRYAVCYPLFLCFVPLWCLYYGRDYIKNGRSRDFLKLYLKGTWAGIVARGR